MDKKSLIKSFEEEKDYLKKIKLAKLIIENSDQEGQPNELSPYYRYIIQNAHYPNWEKDRANALLSQGTIEYVKSNFQLALDYLSESAKIYNELGDEVHYANVMNNIAIVYTATNQEMKAIEIYKKIVERFPQDSSIKVNYANLVLKQGSAKLALSLLEDSYKLALQAGVQQNIVNVVIELSNYYNNQGKPEKSLELLLAITNNELEITKRSQVFAFLNISEAFLLLDRLNEAETWFEKALSIAMETSVDELLWFSYIIAIKLYKGKKDWKSACYYSELKQGLTEKIYISKLNDKMNEIESSYHEKIEDDNQSSYSEKTIRLASLGVMASGIAHEINQPLNAIMIDAQALLFKDDVEKVLPSGYRDRIEYIVQATRRISKIVDHIRFYWSHKNSVARQEFDVNQVISEAMSLMEQQIKSHQISLKLMFVPQRLLIFGSRVSLEQIVINLVANAIQALDNLERQEKRIIITTKRSSDNCLIYIDDNGHGIPEEISEYIFEPFVTSKQQGYGTGLGLTLVQNFSKDLNAQIEHTKNKMGGCRFIVTIPLVQTIEED